MNEPVVYEVRYDRSDQVRNPSIPREDDLSHLCVNGKHNVINCLIRRHAALFSCCPHLLLMHFNRGCLAVVVRYVLEEDWVLAEVGVNGGRAYNCYEDLPFSLHPQRLEESSNSKLSCAVASAIDQPDLSWVTRHNNELAHSLLQMREGIPLRVFDQWRLT